MTDPQEPRDTQPAGTEDEQGDAPEEDLGTSDDGAVAGFLEN